MGRTRKIMDCHACGGPMRRGVRPLDLTYRGRTLTVDQPGWYCERCDETVLTAEDMKTTEPKFLAFKAEVDGVLAPQEVAAIRRKLGLSQRRAGSLLGGGPRAFQKYESGAVAVSAPMSNLLRLLRRDPRRLAELTPDGE